METTLDQQQLTAEIIKSRKKYTGELNYFEALVGLEPTSSTMPECRYIKPTTKPNGEKVDDG